MAQITSDFLKETSTTTGTGNITLLGARTPGSTLASAIGIGDTFEYGISHDTLNQWETGIGTMLTSTTFSRSVLTSSNANALVNFSAGTKRVDVVMSSTRLKRLVGPVQVGATTLGSGTLSFQGTGVTFALSTNSAGGTVHASAGGGGAAGFQVVSVDAVGLAANDVTAMTGTSSLSATRLVFPLLATDSTFSIANVFYRLSSDTLFGIANINWRGGVSVHRANVFSGLDANGVSWLMSSADVAVLGKVAQLVAFVPRIRQAELYVMGGAQLGSITNATDSTLSNSTAATLRFPLLGTANNSFFSTANVQFRLSSDSLIGVAWMRVSAPVGGGQVAHNLEFSNANGASFGMATSTLAGLGKVLFLTASVDPQLGMVSHIGGQSVASVRTLAFSDASNVTWSLSTAANAATVIASVATAAPGGGITALAMSNSVSSVGATGVTYSAANGFSFLLSTGAGNAATLSGSYTVPTLTSLSFSNLNGVTFGTAGSTLTASVNPEIGIVSHIGGNVQSSVRTLAFSNASNVTFSLSTAANAATVIASVGAAGGGITYSGFKPHFGAAVIVTQSLTNNSVWVQPFNDAPAFQFDRVVQLFGLSNATNATNSNTLRYFIGVYTRNVSTLSLVASASFSQAFTGSGTVGNYSQFSGPRHVTMGMTQTLDASDYWVACAASLATAGNSSFSVSFGMLSQSLSNQVYGFGLASNATYQSILGKGFYTATSSAAPGSIAFSQINGTNSAAYRFPALYFGSGTA